MPAAGNINLNINVLTQLCLELQTTELGFEHVVSYQVLCCLVPGTEYYCPRVCVLAGVHGRLDYHASYRDSEVATLKLPTLLLAASAPPCFLKLFDLDGRRTLSNWGQASEVQLGRTMGFGVGGGDLRPQFR